MSRPVTRSMTRTLLAEKEEEAMFRRNVNDEINSIMSTDALLNRLCQITDGEAGLRQTCKVLLLVNATFERFVEPSMTMTYRGKLVQMSGIMQSLRKNCLGFLPELSQRIKHKSENRPMWLLETTIKATIEYLALFDYLIARSSSTETRIVNHQKRILNEKARMSRK